MVKRKRVGLVYSYDENWVAGSYYILNIIHALNTVEEHAKPEIVLLTDSMDTFNKVKKETQYPFIKEQILPFKAEYNLIEKIINKVSKVLLKKKVISKTPKFPKLDFLYPQEINGLSKNLKKVNWIPDFQEEHLPQFFPSEEIVKRKNYQKNVLVNSDIVVFSSENAKKDFERLYPHSNSALFVLPFAVTHPDYSNENIDQLLVKYSLPKDYFFAPNQFWAHKNHMVILKAIKLLKDKGENVTVAFSGKESDFRNLYNFTLLKTYIEDNKLENQIKFLGFIERTEQLCLIANSVAVIQPSLFEGWSTVVEDAKALNKFIILSNLEVHKEQIQENSHFFESQNENILASIIEKYHKNQPKVVKVNYERDINEFAIKFIDLINSATK